MAEPPGERRPVISVEDLWFRYEADDSILRGVNLDIYPEGFLAITGSPALGRFNSEFSILNGGFGAGRFLVGALFLSLLLIIFIGMGRTVLTVVQGRPPAAAALQQ